MNPIVIYKKTHIEYILKRFLSLWQTDFERHKSLFTNADSLFLCSHLLIPIGSKWKKSNSLRNGN